MDPTMSERRLRGVGCTVLLEVMKGKGGGGVEGKWKCGIESSLRQSIPKICQNADRRRYRMPRTRITIQSQILKK
jgi:hypothetical protein